MMLPNIQNINKVVEGLRQLKLELTIKGGLSDFLGVRIEQIDDDNYHLLQTHQIDKVLRDLGL